MELPTILKFDELNKNGSGTRKMKSLPYNQYFGEMNITPKERKMRNDLAIMFEDVFDYLLIIMLADRELGNVQNKYKYYNAGTQRYVDVLDESGYEKDEYPKLYEHAEDVVEEVVDTTIKNIVDDWSFTDDRVKHIAENEANAIREMARFRDAAVSGKTKKTWVDFGDDAVRDTHRAVNGTTIPIDALFVVGDSLMLHPKDDSNGASAREIVGCRCTVEYS